MEQPKKTYTPDSAALASVLLAPLGVTYIPVHRAPYYLLDTVTREVGITQVLSHREASDMNAEYRASGSPYRWLPDADSDGDL